MFNLTDIAALVISFFTLIFVQYKTRVPFKRHTMNIYQYQMLILILLGLGGKLLYFNRSSPSITFSNHDWSFPDKRKDTDGCFDLDLACILYIDGIVHFNLKMGIRFKLVCNWVRGKDCLKLAQITLFRLYQTNTDLCYYYVFDLHVQLAQRSKFRGSSRVFPISGY